MKTVFCQAETDDRWEAYHSEDERLLAYLNTRIEVLKLLQGHIDRCKARDKGNAAWQFAVHDIDRRLNLLARMKRALYDQGEQCVVITKAGKIQT